MAAGSAPPPASSPPVHPAVAPLSYLLGRWKGEGEGGYPTINSFKYGEELLFSHSGKVRPILFINLLKKNSYQIWSRNFNL